MGAAAISSLARDCGLGIAAAVKLLLEKNFKIDEKDRSERTALYLAALNGHLRAIQLLLEKDFNTEAKNIDGRTALHLAAVNGHEELVRRLI
jgi:ankyrin repeat protein